MVVKRWMTPGSFTKRSSISAKTAAVRSSVYPSGVMTLTRNSL
jgi:hypothetical protein